MRNLGWKTMWVIAILGFFGGSLALVLTGDDTGAAADTTEQITSGESKFESKTATEPGNEPGEKTPAAPVEPVIAKNDDGCLADSATLADLRRLKQELEARKSEIAAREAEIKTREKALDEQIKQLAVAREDIEKIDQSRKVESDAKVAKLVEAVESMNPKAASQLLATLDEALATATMSKLSTAKLAKVLNVMDPARSTRLSELLAGVARAKTRTASNDAAAATNERTVASNTASGSARRADDPTKGGDKNDGKSHEQANNRSTPDRATGKSSK